MPTTTGIQLNVWGAEYGDKTGLKNQMQSNLQGGSVGHASLSITIPADEKGIELIKKYCTDPSIPFERRKVVTHKAKKDSDGKYVKTDEIEFEEEVFVINWSWWPPVGANEKYKLSDGIQSDSVSERVGVNVNWSERGIDLLSTENAPHTPHQRYHSGGISRQLMSYGTQGIVHGRDLLAEETSLLNKTVQQNMQKEELDGLNLLIEKLGKQIDSDVIEAINTDDFENIVANAKPNKIKLSDTEILIINRHKHELTQDGKELNFTISKGGYISIEDICLIYEKINDLKQTYETRIQAFNDEIDALKKSIEIKKQPCYQEKQALESIKIKINELEKEKKLLNKPLSNALNTENLIYQKKLIQLNGQITKLSEQQKQLNNIIEADKRNISPEQMHTLDMLSSKLESLLQKKESLEISIKENNDLLSPQLLQLQKKLIDIKAEIKNLTIEKNAFEESLKTGRKTELDLKIDKMDDLHDAFIKARDDAIIKAGSDPKVGWSVVLLGKFLEFDKDLIDSLMAIDKDNIIKKYVIETENGYKIDSGNISLVQAKLKEIKDLLLTDKATFETVKSDNELSDNGYLSLGTPPDISQRLSFDSNENEPGFELEPMLQRMQELVREDQIFELHGKNCSKTVMSILEAGAKAQAKHVFKSTASDTGLMTPQVVFNAAQDYTTGKYEPKEKVKQHSKLKEKALKTFIDDNTPKFKQKLAGALSFLLILPSYLKAYAQDKSVEIKAYFAEQKSTNDSYVFQSTSEYSHPFNDQNIIYIEGNTIEEINKNLQDALQNEAYANKTITLSQNALDKVKTIHLDVQYDENQKQALLNEYNQLIKQSFERIKPVKPEDSQILTSNQNKQNNNSPESERPKRKRKKGL